VQIQLAWGHQPAPVPLANLNAHGLHFGYNRQLKVYTLKTLLRKKMLSQIATGQIPRSAPVVPTGAPAV